MLKTIINEKTDGALRLKMLLSQFFVYLLLAIILMTSMNLIADLKLLVFSFILALAIFLIFKQQVGRSFYLGILSAIFVVYLFNVVWTYILVKQKIDNDNNSIIVTRDILLLHPLVTIVYSSSDQFIDDIKNRLYVDQEVKVLIKDQEITFLLKGSMVKSDGTKETLLLFLFSLLFLLVFYTHYNIDISLNNYRKIGNYLIIGTFVLASHFGMEKMSGSSHVDISQLSQESFKNRFFYKKLYINEKNKNICVVVKGKRYGL